MSRSAIGPVPGRAAPGGETTGTADAVRDLLTTVLHEVRAPLASLTATVEVLADSFDDLDPQDARAMLSRMQRSATWLQALVENLTTAALLEAGQLHLARGPVDLAECVETALAVAQPLLERAGQRVTVRGEGGLRGLGDARGVERVLVNLLMNASKYGGAGTPIEVALARDGGRVRVRVSDHGPGIPPAEQGRIFERYARGSAAERGGVGGLGLGLHIVKTLVERQGGQVGLDSTPGHGASFWFSLPLAIAGRAQARGARRSDSPARQPAGAAPRPG